MADPPGVAFLVNEDPDTVALEIERDHLFADWDAGRFADVDDLGLLNGLTKNFLSQPYCQARFPRPLNSPSFEALVKKR